MRTCDAAHTRFLSGSAKIAQLTQLCAVMAIGRIDSYTLAGLFCALLWMPLAVAEPVPVGEITLVLGGASLLGPEAGTRQAAVKGAIYVGDRIETRADGHVHVRFVDSGRVSVRPASRLTVEDYRPADAADESGTPGAIRFRLDHGVVRSITGRWGEAARERFRLNAPFAAIGVRGTDFVVQSQADRVRVLVHSGAVTLTPFGGLCDPVSLGNCGGVGARELSAGMGGVMLELRRHQDAPRFLPRNGSVADMLMASADAGAAARPAGGIKSDSDKAIVQDAVRQALPALSALPPPPAPLVWGRWAHVTERPGDVLTTSRAQAADDGRERIAENNYYALYRLPDAGNIQRTDSVALGIGSAQAHLVTLDGVQSAAVQGGYLNLNFATRSFDTGLDLHSDPTGNVALQANGAIRPDGTFSSATVYTRVSGGLADEGNQAAYLFEQSTPDGMLTGIVNWR